MHNSQPLPGVPSFSNFQPIFFLKTSHIKSFMTVPTPVTDGENGLKDWRTPVSALVFFPFFHLSTLSSIPCPLF